MGGTEGAAEEAGVLGEASNRTTVDPAQPGEDPVTVVSPAAEPRRANGGANRLERTPIAEQI